jgi:hypothetical protein
MSIVRTVGRTAASTTISSATRRVGATFFLEAATNAVEEMPRDLLFNAQ